MAGATTQSGESGQSGRPAGGPLPENSDSKAADQQKGPISAPFSEGDASETFFEGDLTAISLPPLSDGERKVSSSADGTANIGRVDVTGENSSVESQSGDSNSGSQRGESGQSISATGPRRGLTPERALLEDELSRTRTFAKVSTGLSILCAAAYLFLPPTGIPMALSAGGFVASAAVFQLMLVMLKTPEQLTSKRLATFVLILIFCTWPCILALGIVSPTPMVFTLGIYAISLGRSRAANMVALIGAIVMYAVPAGLYASGVVEDPGLFSSKHVGPQVLIILTLLVTTIYVLTYQIARRGRHATKLVINQLHDAALQLQKRDALLAEANQDLDRALKAGYAGRYSETRIESFVLGQVIGRGAMGEVYRAKDLETGGMVAIKVLHPEVLSQPQHVRRFLREAEIVSALKNPHIVRVIKVGNADRSEFDQVAHMPYIAMELLEGNDLAWHLRKKKRLHMSEVLTLIDHIADALTTAGSKQIVHRDLKPQNIFGAMGGVPAGVRWKVLDFGVSKLVSGSGTLTQGAVVGTPAYMAPEQARGGEIGPSADVFALAAIAYRAITGRPAFSGADMPRVLFDVCYRQPVRPSELVKLAADIDRVLLLGLAKDSARRVSQAAEFAKLLRLATRRELPDSVRRAADTLEQEMPWGARP